MCLYEISKAKEIYRSRTLFEVSASTAVSISNYSAFAGEAE
jgi:hypothetical protein